MEAAQKRSIAKTITWRIIGTLTLASVVYFFTNRSALSINIGMIDLASNFLLYYLHERAWDLSDWERLARKDYFYASKKRVLAKTISWRITASSLLLIIAFVFTKKPVLSANIALVDALLNIIEYYAHEWLWNFVTWGRRKNG